MRHDALLQKQRKDVHPDGDCLKRERFLIYPFLFSLDMAVGQKNVPKMEPWQMETWTATCGPLVV